MRFLLIGVVVAALVYVVSAGHVLFLPLFFLIPLGFAGGRRRRRQRERPGWRP